MDTVLPSLFIAGIDLHMQLDWRGGKGLEPIIRKGHERGFLSMYSSNTYAGSETPRIVDSGEPFFDYEYSISANAKL
jgi:hypothetical protein